MKEEKQLIFDPFRLDSANQRLWRGDQLVPLRPKPFAVLAYLVERSGQLITKDELLDALWPETSVSDTVLKVCIREIREALGDGAAAPQFIETAHRFGYRFIATVKTGPNVHIQPEEPVSVNVRREGAARKVIAVLPFKLLKPGSDDEHLGLGMADALITRLSNLKTVVVRPTSAVRKYTSPDQDAVAAGRELRVESVLDGSIHRSDERIRVTVQFIDVETEAPIWADKFDARFTDIFTVEDLISEQVTDALTLKLTGDERKLLTKRYTRNTAAYQLYLKGRYYWTKRTAEGLKRGIDYFQQAIEMDPNYAMAYSGLADYFAQLSWTGLLSPAQAFPKARAAALKALELDSSLPEAHTSLAWVRMLYDWQWLDAEREFKRAIDLNPNYALAHLWYAVHLIASSRFDEALTAANQAQEVDPLSPLINTITGWPYYFMGQYQRAIEQYQKALEFDPKHLPAHVLLGTAYAQTGDFSKAIEEFQWLLMTDETPFVLAALGYAYAVSGRDTEAQEILGKLVRLSAECYVSPYDVALIYAGLKDKERAFQWLEKAYEDRSSWLIFLPVEPKLETLRTDARFVNLQNRIRLAG